MLKNFRGTISSGLEKEVRSLDIRAWQKFSKIVVFLYTVREYIVNQSNSLDKNKQGYYQDVNKLSSQFKITTIGTTNYSTFISEIIQHEIEFLNGGTDIFYDPYVNTIVQADSVPDHIVVPLLFTQSGTKPMTSIDMSEKYVNFYNELIDSDIIVVIGFAFNSDDEHINGIFRQLIDKHEKKICIVDVDSDNEYIKRERLQEKLKIQNTNNIHFINVDTATRKTTDGNWWYDCISSFV